MFSFKNGWFLTSFRGRSMQSLPLQLHLISTRPIRRQVYFAFEAEASIFSTGNLWEDGLGQERGHLTHRVQILPGQPEKGGGAQLGGGLQRLRQNRRRWQQTDPVGRIPGKPSCGLCYKPATILNYIYRVAQYITRLRWEVLRCWRLNLIWLTTLQLMGLPGVVFYRDRNRLYHAAKTIIFFLGVVTIKIFFS